MNEVAGPEMAVKNDGKRKLDGRRSRGCLMKEAEFRLKTLYSFGRNYGGGRTCGEYLFAVASKQPAGLAGAKARKRFPAVR